jgi:hypothetical protein
MKSPQQAEGKILTSIHCGEAHVKTVSFHYSFSIKLKSLDSLATGREKERAWLLTNEFVRH